ncbi:HEAT repeat domain-containing protein [Streptomyces sp. NPDC051563]|uniref:HEAT repeat domain-containing protein n=1 Tax=Streptomyces sp. NPDC051563 TaxID=3365659 RepID=UPI003793B872
MLLRRVGAEGVEAVRVGRELMRSAGVLEREVGCDVMGEASDQEPAVRCEAADALADLARGECEGGVLRALARAIGRTGEGAAVAVLVVLAGHADPAVRREVASSFAGLDTGRAEGPGVLALIRLTRDVDPEVREWATFSLGFQSEADGPAVRAALWERTVDAHGGVREEGIRGLARRHELRVLPLLKALLEDAAGAHVHTFAAAQIMGAPELLPALQAYEAHDVGVAAAVRACDREYRARHDGLAWDLVVELHRLRPELDGAIRRELFGPALELCLQGLGPDPGDGPVYDVEALLERAGGDPVRAAELVSRRF